MHNSLIYRQIYKSKPFALQVSSNYLIINILKDLLFIFSGH